MLGSACRYFYDLNFNSERRISLTLVNSGRWFVQLSYVSDNFQHSSRGFGGIKSAGFRYTLHGNSRRSIYSTSIRVSYGSGRIQNSFYLVISLLPLYMALRKAITKKCNRLTLFLPARYSFFTVD